MEQMISLNEAVGGMVLSRPVINENGRIVLMEGTVLSPTQIVRLHSMGVDSLQIRIGQATPSSDRTVLATTYRETVTQVKHAFTKMHCFQEEPILHMKELVNTSLEPMIGMSGIINHLQTVKTTDDYTFQHSIRVAVISGILGKWLGFSGDQLKDITLSGLLHDIGKIKLPPELLNKPQKLTASEMATARNHPLEGYRLLNKSPSVAPEVLLGVLQHHERNDGSGYPMGCGSEKIHQYAQIIAVADIYDAMTSDRVYQDRSTPFQVVDVVHDHMYQQLDLHICMVFLNNVRNYFIGNLVVLNDGRRAEVISLHPTPSTRPVVRTNDGEFIDLEQQREMVIVDFITA